MKKRYNKPLFWFALVGTFLSATRIDPTTLTSWQILMQKLHDVFANPYLLGLLVVAMIGVWNNPTTKGLGDGNDKQ